MQRINWDDGSGPRKPRMQFINVKYQEIVLLLGPPVGLNVHWMGRTVACTTPKCKHCEQGRAGRWVGYCPVLHQFTTNDGGEIASEWRQSILSIPASSRLVFSDPMLMGSILHVRRQKRGERAAGLQVVKCTKPAGARPESFDVKPHVEHLFFGGVRSSLPAALPERALPPAEEYQAPAVIPFLRKGAN